MSDEEREEEAWSDRPEEGSEEGAQEEMSAEPEPEQPGIEEPDIGAYLSQAWEMVAAEPALFIAGFLLLFALVSASAVFVVGPLIIGGPLLFGYLDVVQKRLDGEPAEIGDIFSGFQRFQKSLVTFALLFAIWLVVGIVQFGAVLVLGFLPCIGRMVGYALPAAVQVLLGAALFFVFPIAAFSETSPTDAVRDSINFCRENPGTTILLSLVTQVLAAVGTVACGVGYFLTAPLAIIMWVLSYNRYYVPNAPEAT